MTAPRYGLYTDSYTAAQVTAGLPGGLFFGDCPNDPATGKTYMFCKADATVAANSAVKTDPAGTPGQQFNVIPTATATDYLLGVCETLGGIANGGAGWITINGPAKCLVAAAVAQSALIAPTATAGQLGAPGATSQLRAQCLAAPGGSPAVVGVHLT
jgi:hypothetical protein